MKKRTLEEQQKRIINMMKTINEDLDPYPDRGGMVRSGQEGTATWPNAKQEVVHQTIVDWLKYMVEKTQKQFPHINISPDSNDLSSIASIILGSDDEGKFTPGKDPREDDPSYQVNQIASRIREDLRKYREFYSAIPNAPQNSKEAFLKWCSITWEAVDPKRDSEPEPQEDLPYPHGDNTNIT
jgi:hypothetical protein